MDDGCKFDPTYVRVRGNLGFARSDATIVRPKEAQMGKREEAKAAPAGRPSTARE